MITFFAIIQSSAISVHSVFSSISFYYPHFGYFHFSASLIPRFHMTNLYCWNFLKQICQWFDNKRIIGGPFIASCKIVVKDDWLERTRARNRTVNQAPIAHTKACCNLHWLKPAPLISHTLVDPLIEFVITTYWRTIFLMLDFHKSKRKFSLNCS